MYINTGYLNHSLIDFKDKSRPLVVGSCGNYRLSAHPKMPTYRPKGRKDFQIIYIASGLGHFHFDTPDNETIVPAGNIVLYQPKEMQKYEYYGKDKTDVYWIHFTGSEVKNILKKYLTHRTRPAIMKSQTKKHNSSKILEINLTRNLKRRYSPMG